MADLAVDVGASLESEGTNRHIVADDYDFVDPDDRPADPVGCADTLGDADVSAVDHVGRTIALGYTDDDALIALRA